MFKMLYRITCHYRRCKLYDNDKHCDKQEHLYPVRGWYFKLSGLNSTLRGQFLNIMDSLKWTILPEKAAAFCEPTLFFCKCLLGANNQQLREELGNCSEFPQEFTMGIVNILEQLGFSIESYKSMNSNGKSALQPQQVWTFPSNKV